MQKLAHIEYQLKIPTGKNKLKPTDTTDISTDTGTSTEKYENDHLYEMLSDVVNPTFRAWYCKAFYKLGRNRVLELAAQACVDGKDRKRLFSYLLKKALNAV